MAGSYRLLETLAGVIAVAALVRRAGGVGHRRRSASCGPRWPPTSTRSGSGSPAAGDLPRRPRRPEARAFLGLGSNLGDRWAHLRKAVDQLRAGSALPVTAVSPVYETDPVGGPEGQGPYLNLVVELAVPARVDPYRLLEECRRLEAAAGRVRTVRWGPRTLDADVLWIDGVTSRIPT